MKLRQGFVSNSSSSSFVIAIPAGMEMNEDNLHKEIFKTSETHIYGPEWENGICVDSREIVKDMIKQIISTNKMVEVTTGEETNSYEREFGGYLGRKGKVPLDRLNEVIRDDSVPYDPEKYETVDENGVRRMDWDKYRADDLAIRNSAVSKVLGRFPNHDFYVVEFADDTSWGSEVEHGRALRKNNILRFSNH